MDGAAMNSEGGKMDRIMGAHASATAQEFHRLNRRRNPFLLKC